MMTKTYDFGFAPIFNGIVNEVNDVLQNAQHNEKTVNRVQVPVNILENEEYYKLAFLAPGHKKESFEINLEGQKLKVALKATEESENGQDRFVRKEFELQGFERVFKLPQTADVEHITAAYQEGILNVTIPKKAEVKQQATIKVN
ncbi:Hsp20/alpha crystallin family protein [Algivirga pacifica]|uniref:SHSP domain-containing protein n=1 Tax=Algivirga pacifica TaxID=1162670 RepID=A0ABP9DFR8_9BACT